MKKSGSVIVVILALILGFIGGAVTPHLMPIAGITELEERIVHLEAELQKIEPVDAPLRIAYMDAERAFTVILDVVAGLRARARTKQDARLELKRQQLAGEIAAEDFQHRNNILSIELLQAQLAINLGAIEKMIAGRGFQDIRGDLELLRDEAQPLEDEISALLVTTMIGGFVDQAEFDIQFAHARAAFSHLDHLLTQVATMKIARAAHQVGIEMGFDMVLLQRNVIIYRNPMRILDVTLQVREKLAEYFMPL